MQQLVQNIYNRLNVAKRTRINHNVLAVPCIFLYTHVGVCCDQVDGTNGLKNPCVPTGVAFLFLFSWRRSLEKEKKRRNDDGHPLVSLGSY